MLDHCDGEEGEEGRKGGEELTEKSTARSDKGKGRRMTPGSVAAAMFAGAQSPGIRQPVDLLPCPTGVQIIATS